MKEARRICLPMTQKDARTLKVGDLVLISGNIVTGRDRIHNYLFNLRPTEKEVPFPLNGTIIYHCGPLMRKMHGGFECIAAGPTTSARLEIYEHRIITEYGIRGVMGKGGMGAQTLSTLQKEGSVYFHAIGGAAVYLAAKVKKVAGVWMLDEFGMTEAMWLLDVEDFPALVTMDAHGGDLHEAIDRKSFHEFRRLAGIGEYRTPPCPEKEVNP